MWIVKVALERPYTFIVLGLLILILSPVVILQTPTDIFPNIDIPVVSVLWPPALDSREQLAAGQQVMHSGQAMRRTRAKWIRLQELNPICPVKLQLSAA